MKRIIFWSVFVIVLALIIVGLVFAMNKDTSIKLPSPSPVDSNDHIIGNISAPVTIIEYSDFQCPACGMYFPVLEKLLSEASTTVRLVYRHYPLPQHQNALPMTFASEAASKKDKFNEMYRLIFENQSDWAESKTPEVFIEKYVNEIGLDPVAFMNDYNLVKSEFDRERDATSTDLVASKIVKDMLSGNKIGILGTPTFFVNGKYIENPQGYEAFYKIIQNAK
jgi:protein-disulfide isomerase